MDEKIQILAKLLVHESLEYAFGVTGSGPSLALITELESLGVRYYPVSHEASAAIMAGTVSRITGRISVSISIKGPGLANMLPGIAHNHFENNSSLSISEAFGNGVPPYQRHKRLNHAALLSSIVKGIISLNEIDQQLPSLLNTAWREVPGPVHLDLCMRDTEGMATALSSSPETSAPSQAAAKEIFVRLNRSERPILVVGSLAWRRNWKEKLPSLTIPIFTTVSAKGVLGESLPHSAGVYTGEGKELAAESHIFKEADLVIGIGVRNTEVLSPKPFGKPTILVDEINSELADGFQADLSLTDADSDFVSYVLNTLLNKSWGEKEVVFSRSRMQKALLDGGWLPPVCFKVLNDLVFPHTLVLDAGSFCTIGEHLWHAGPDRFFMGSSNGRFMGVALPSAVASALCNAGMPVFCVVGDGGMRTYPTKVKLAVQERLPICLILMKDGNYASVVCAPQSRPMSRRAVTVFQPSWWRSVEAMGCEAHPVDSEESFAATVQSWNRRGPLFIEASFDPEAYAGMTNRLR